MGRDTTRPERLRPVTAPASAWAAVILVAATGCTICPDPFDYSGPVPNGSAPQNDFRARSNGIIPLGGVSRPWPPVVQAAPDDADESATSLAAAEEAAAEDQATDAADDHADDETVTVVATTAEADDETDTSETEIVEMDTIDAEAPAIAEPMLDEILPPGPPLRLPILPPLRETPGWRPRR